MSPRLFRLYTLLLLMGTALLFAAGWRSARPAARAAPLPAAAGAGDPPPAPGASPPAAPPAPAPAADSPTPAPVPSAYTVQRGDTLYAISRRLGVDVAALKAANGLRGDLLQVGQILKVPTGAATSHEVRPGDTAWEIALTYGVTLEELGAANPGADLTDLRPAQVLKLPAGARYGAARGLPVPTVSTGAAYIWPVQGWISSEFGPRVSPLDGIRRFHSGVDIAANHGDDVAAARAGTAVTTGSLPGYGYTVVLEHPDGTRTLYAHLSRILVQRGQVVQQGERIALVGSTGASTGPHLHFEIIAGTPVDPLAYLPGGATARR